MPLLSSLTFLLLLIIFNISENLDGFHLLGTNYLWLKVCWIHCNITSNFIIFNAPEILEITNIFKKPEPHEEGMYFFNSNVNDSKYSSEPDAKYWKTFDILRESFELPRSSVKQPRLLCWMMTDPDILEKARPAQLTWFSKCDVPLIFSSDENDAFPTIGLKAPPGRKSIAAKAHLAWEHVYRNYKDKADFFMKADPDSYVFVNNLKR